MLILPILLFINCFYKAMNLPVIYTDINSQNKTSKFIAKSIYIGIMIPITMNMLGYLEIEPALNQTAKAASFVSAHCCFAKTPACFSKSLSKSDHTVNFKISMTNKAKIDPRFASLEKRFESARNSKPYALLL